MYLTYEQYEEMGGTLDDTIFNSFEYEAETIVNWYTFNRLRGEETYPEELPRCMYRLIELLKLRADAMILGKLEGGSNDGSDEGLYIKSQSNDGVSVSYNSINASDLFKDLSFTAKGNPFETTVFRYLQGVRNSKNKRLTYRGLYPDE